jgi:hypothetical protein
MVPERDGAAVMCTPLISLAVRLISMIVLWAVAL